MTAILNTNGGFDMDEQNTPTGLTEVDTAEIALPAADEDSRNRTRWRILAKSGAFPTDTSHCDVWSGNTRDIEALGSGSFADLVESLEAVGQKVPAIARISPADPRRLEIIAGACRLTAIRQINGSRGADEQMPIIVEVRELDDEAALKIVDAENRGRSEMSQYEKARFYERAIPGIFPTESALAGGLGLDKSTVNRTLAITRLSTDVMALIRDPHSISAAQASGFLRDWNLPELRDTLNDAIAELAEKAPASAAAVFKALREAIAPPAETECAEILHDGVSVGSLRRGKGGVTIKLLPSADGLVLKPLVIGIGHALKQIGFK